MKGYESASRRPIAARQAPAGLTGVKATSYVDNFEESRIKGWAYYAGHADTP